MVANSTLDRNLGALLVLNGALAKELAEVQPVEGLTWLETDEGEASPSALYKEEGAGGGGGGAEAVARALASRRTPRAEGERWAAQADLSRHAAFVVRGFGLGYHVGALAKRVGGKGVVLVFEPDKRLLRAVLERIDCTAWLAGVMVFVDPDDRGAMSEAAGHVEPLMAMGTVMLDHPASLARLSRDRAASRFAERFTTVVATVRVNMASTLMQTAATMRNCLQNMDQYATRAGIEPLRGLFKGRTAIVVSAGPSLQRNVEMLSRPGVADRFVIVAVQTVLKPLLERGIRPHFVCALDYHEVSRRFYEGLTAEMVEGVTLIAEPKVNPAVPAAFPGMVRMVGDSFLDLVLGDPAADKGGLARPMGRLQSGTTVAHLCCYFARFLGCDPVCLIGQDLGFTDGQYYAAGAAIHGVWGAELNEFKTLETLEWQRIVRHRNMLRRETDHLGRPVYTDEQMHTYLMQFARDFRADAQAGLTTVDASEGGVRKPDTVPRTLAEVIDEGLANGEPGPSVGDLLRRVERSEVLPEGPRTLRAVAERLRTVRQGVRTVGELSKRAESMLVEAGEHHKDQERVNGLVAKLDALRGRVKKIEPGWSLVQWLNQLGAFRRLRADRAIAVEGEGLDAMERQARQIERDRQNVRWLADASAEMAGLLDRAIATVNGGERQTREPGVGAVLADGSGGAVSVSVDSASTLKAAGIVMHNARAAWWGAAREAAVVRVQGRAPLSLTLERIGRAQRIGPIVVATDDPAAARRASEGTPAATLSRVAFERVAPGGASGWPAPVLRAARSLAATCWRGGINDLTVFDEVLDAGTAAALMEALGQAAPAAVVVGGSWCCIDPALIDAVVERHAEDPVAHRFAFAHAAPGLGVALLDRKLMGELASARKSGGLWGSVGGLLGYSPVAPAADVIGKGLCVPTDAAVRQLMVRATAESAAEAQWLEWALNAAGLEARSATASQVAAAVNALATDEPASLGLRHVEMRLVEGGGETLLRSETVERWLALLTERSVAGLTVTLRDAHLAHPEFRAILDTVQSAAGGSLCVHVRTDLCGSPDQAAMLLDARPDLVSVDCHADTPELYASLTRRSREAFARLRTNLEQLVENRSAVEEGGVLRLPLVVPRLTRRDAVYEQVEHWYDRHLLACGWAVLDPLDSPIAGERITPLPVPAIAARRHAAHTTVVHADGRVQGAGAALLDGGGVKR